MSAQKPKATAPAVVNITDKLSVVLLPGLDGTGRLFAPLLQEFPPEVESHVISYRPDVALGYEKLLQIVQSTLAQKPFVLVAESFSGPLALQIASTGLNHLRGVVLIASFVSNPRPSSVCAFVHSSAPGCFDGRSQTGRYAISS